MPGDFSADDLKLMQLFMPYMMQKYFAAKSEERKFVHYTSADAAVKIIKNKEVWMRKSSCMNDFTEVQHGMRCLINAYGDRFKKAIDAAYPDMSKEIEEIFNKWKPHFERDTYFTCVSEHEKAEDILGRLSMWRAYSEGTGVGLVLNNTPFLTVSDALGAHTSPVAYLSDAEFADEFSQLTTTLEGSVELLKSLDRQQVFNSIFGMLRFAALCTKHPGFKEEREWRVVFQPSFDSQGPLVRSVETVRGIPQPIYKIPLQDLSAKGLPGLTIGELLHHVIIGPTQFAGPMYEAFVDLIKEAGVADAEKKVVVSNVPLRT